MIGAFSLISTGVATLGNLLIGVFAWRGGDRRGRDFANLCFALALWTGALLAQSLFADRMSTEVVWLAALTLPPLAWRFVLGESATPPATARPWILSGTVASVLAAGALVVFGESAIPWIIPYLFSALIGAVLWLYRLRHQEGQRTRHTLGVGGGLAAALSLVDALPYLGVTLPGDWPRLAPLGTLILSGLLASHVARHRLYQITPLLSGAVTMAALSLLVAAMILWPAESGAGDRTGRLLFASLLLFGFVFLQPPLQRFLRGPFQRQRSRRRERFVHLLEGLDEVLTGAADPRDPARLLVERLQRSNEVQSVGLTTRVSPATEDPNRWIGELRSGERQGGRLEVTFHDSWLAREDAVRHGLATALSRVSTMWHALELQQEALRSRNLARLGTLSAGVAHEIRNPLGAIRGALDLLDGSALPGDGNRWLSIVREESERLDRFVEEVLEFARTPEPRRVCVSLATLLEETCELARAQAQEAGVTLHVRAEENGSANLDPDQMRHALLNLVLNAIQAPGDQVRHVTLEGVVAEDGSGHLTVSDDGPGVPEELHEQVFDPFFTTRARGTGLGLAIVRQIAEAHRASLHLLEPEPGTGARFRIAWPAPGPADVAPEVVA